MISNIKKIFNYDPFKWKVKTSAGIILILRDEKMLFCHPTGHNWTNSFSFPKGGVDDGESEIDAAIRELKEETSIVIDKNQIINPNNPHIVEYRNKKGVLYKKIILYTVKINDISEVHLESELLKKEQLQLEEIDWCGFLTKEEVKTKIFHRVSHLIDLVCGN